MRLLATAALAPLLALTLTACGGDDSSGGADSSSQQSSGQSTETESEGPGYPTDASVKEYCNAYSGEDPETNTDPTVGDFTGYLQQGRDEIVRVGIPENFTDAEQAAFEEQLSAFDETLALLKQEDQSKSAMTLRKNKEFVKAMNEVDTPAPLKEYSKKNC